jgi:hypothetical protein
LNALIEYCLFWIDLNGNDKYSPDSNINNSSAVSKLLIIEEYNHSSNYILHFSFFHNIFGDAHVKHSQYYFVLRFHAWWTIFLCSHVGEHAYDCRIVHFIYPHIYILPYGWSFHIYCLWLDEPGKCVVLEFPCICHFKPISDEFWKSSESVPIDSYHLKNWNPCDQFELEYESWTLKIENDDDDIWFKYVFESIFCSETIILLF